jgi:hypothetical protein
VQWETVLTSCGISSVATLWPLSAVLHCCISGCHIACYVGPRAGIDSLATEIGCVEHALGLSENGVLRDLDLRADGSYAITSIN